MLKRRVLELSLEKVEVHVVGGARKKRGKHMIMTGLIWPRAAIAEKVSIKTLDFENRSVELSRSAWTDKILFKETVQGTFGVELRVTDRLSDSQIAAFLDFMGSSMLKVAGHEAGDLVAGSLGSGLVRIPFHYLSQQDFFSKKQPAGIIGRGAVDLVPDSRWKAGKRVRVNIPLVAPAPICKIVRNKKHGVWTSRRRTVLKAGSENGMAVVSATLYD